MKTALEISCVAVLICCGCGKKTVAPAPAAPPPPPPRAPTIAFQPIPFLKEIPAAASVTNTVVQWEVILTEFKTDAVQELGLARLFEGVGDKNAVSSEETERSPLAQMARANSNIVLNLMAGSYAARCTFEESTNLLDHFHKSFGIDILSQPRITTKGTNLALMQVVNNLTVVLSGLDPSEPTAILATNISVGPTVSTRLLAHHENKIAIEVSARLEEFAGYERNDQKMARPNLKVTTMGTRTELRTNEVLLLGSPVRMSVTKTSDSVAYLSDIPFIGRLFTETHMHTNFTRIMVILRPRLQ